MDLFHHGTLSKRWGLLSLRLSNRPRAQGFLRWVLKGYKQSGEWLDAWPYVQASSLTGSRVGNTFDAHGYDHASS